MKGYSPKEESKWKKRAKEALKFVLGIILGASVTIGVYTAYGSPLFTITSTTSNIVATYTTTSVSTLSSITTVIDTAEINRLNQQITNLQNQINN